MKSLGKFLAIFLGGPLCLLVMFAGIAWVGDWLQATVGPPPGSPWIGVLVFVIAWAAIAAVFTREVSP